MKVECVNLPTRRLIILYLSYRWEYRSRGDRSAAHSSESTKKNEGMAHPNKNMHICRKAGRKKDKIFGLNYLPFGH